MMKSRFLSRNTRTFLLVLGATCVLWLMLSMSEVKEYSASYRVDYVGYDTARYALVVAPDSIHLKVGSTGLQTLIRNRHMRNKHIQLHLSGMISDADTNDVQRFDLFLAEQLDAIRQQLDVSQSNRVVLNTEHFLISIARREAKVLVPVLRGVNFEFAEGFVLGGNPQWKCDSVVLYGSRKSLDAITEISTLPASIGPIRKSGYHDILLDTTWRRYSDLRISNDCVQVFVPVEEAIERNLTIPVKVVCDNPNLKIRLYPDQVDVSFWVSPDVYSSVTDDMFEVTAEYKEGSIVPELKLNIERFPSQVKVKSINPLSVRYVVIK